MSKLTNCLNSNADNYHKLKSRGLTESEKDTIKLDLLILGIAEVSLLLITFIGALFNIYGLTLVTSFGLFIWCICFNLIPFTWFDYITLVVHICCALDGIAFTVAGVRRGSEQVPTEDPEVAEEQSDAKDEAEK